MLLFASIQEHLRPKIKIRSLTMVNDLTTRIEDKAPFRFAITLTNHGGSRARIKSKNFTILIVGLKDVPTWGYGEPAYRPPFDFLKNEVIPRGPDAFFVKEAERAYSEPEIRKLIEEKQFLHIVGFIWYKGRFQLRGYKTAFCRTYDVASESLIPSGGDEFEFVD